jgi:hypothetical protein
VKAEDSILSSVKLKECVVCMSASADGVLMPCGHSGICYECALQMLMKDANNGADNNAACHLCRENIEQILKVDIKTVFQDYIRVIESA